MTKPHTRSAHFKDYRESPKRSASAQTKRKKNQSSFSIIVLVFFLVICIVATLFFIRYRLNTVSQHSALNNAVEQTEDNEIPVIPEAAAPPTPRFEFYSLLSGRQPATLADQPSSSSPPQNKKVAPPPALPSQDPVLDLPPSSVAQPAAAAEKTAAAPAEKSLPPKEPLSADARGYWVQVDTFSQYASADSLKAELLLLGFDDPKVQSFAPQPKEKAYRVVLGPFAEWSQAKELEGLLRHQHFSKTQILAP